MRKGDEGHDEYGDAQFQSVHRRLLRKDAGDELSHERGRVKAFRTRRD